MQPDFRRRVSTEEKENSLHPMRNAQLHVTFLTFAFCAVLASSTLQKRNLSKEIYMDDPSIRQSGSCASVCRFRLCELNFYGDIVMLRAGGLLVLPNQRNVVPWPWICLPSSRNEVGNIEAGEVRLIADNGRFVPISSFKRSNVTLGPFLRKNIIFSAPLNAPRGSFRRSGIAVKQTLSPRQTRQIENRCVVMPIKRYNLVAANGRLVDIAVGDGRKDCVSFTATSRTPRFRIELHWSNQDELDLTVKEPDGAEVSRLFPWNSRTGGVYLPGPRGICGRNPFTDLNENVEWPDSASPLPGEYRVTVEYSRSCREGPVEWFLFLNVNGNCNLLEAGFHMFTFPRERIGSSSFVLSSGMLTRQRGEVASCIEELDGVL